MRLKVCVGLCAIVLILVGVLASPVSADIAPKWSDAELVGFSEVILTGTVASITSGRDTTGAIYTYVTVNVGNVLKGWIFEDQIVIKQLGGAVEDDGLFVHGQPSFEVGQETLLFLEVRPRDESLYTSALWQGKWDVETDASGQRIATRRMPDMSDLGVFDGRDLRDLGSFLAGLRSLAGPDALRPGRFLNVRPRETPAAGVAAGISSAPYTLLGPGRWRQPDTGVSVILDRQSGGQPGLSGGGATQLANATGLWMNAGSTSFKWSSGNTSAAAKCQGDADAGRTLVTFNDPCAETSNTGGVLAVGGFTYSSTHTNSGQTYYTAISGFLNFNDGSVAQQFVTNSGCFQDIATHELGHSIGFGHSSVSGTIMFPSISFSSCSGGAHSLHSDDVAVIRFVYPGSGGTTTVPGAPTSFVATASGSTVTLTWKASPALTGVPISADALVASAPSAATSYFIEAGSSSGGSNLAAFSTGSTALKFTAGGVGSGTYYLRVKGQNSAGKGAGSNEAILTVGTPAPGPCTSAPPAPGTLSFTRNGSTVVLKWGAAAGSTSYQLEAGSATGLSNLVVSNTGSTATTLTATSVGKGTYFVRVKGKNACGTGGASNEVKVVVS